MSELANWLLQLVKDLFSAVCDFISDLVIELFDLILQAIVTVISAIPMPSFLTDYSLGTIFGSMGSDILFFAGALKIPLGLSLLAAGLAFRLLRKAVTLGQW